MKRTDLEKLKGLTIRERMKRERLGERSAGALSRREQRELERARGVVPFAVKLNSALVERVRALAEARQASVDQVVAELLELGLGDKP
jgi:hypothetical protein